MQVLFTYPLTDEARAAFAHAAPAGLRLLAPVSPDPAELAGLLPEADVIVVNKASLSAEAIAVASRLKQIHAYPGALPSVDTAAAERAGIPVFTVPQPALLGVAEHTILLMLALVKRLTEADQRTRAGERVFEPVRTTQTKIGFNWLGFTEYGMLYGKTLGLIGLGAIALEVVKRARAFGMEVLYYKRTPLTLAEEEALGAQYRPLDQLLAEADFVSLHHRIQEGEAPMGIASFRQMKPTAFLINTARGPLLDEAELAEALREGLIAGAGLDVFEYEPLLPDNPLLGLKNVVLTPHMAGIPNAVSAKAEAQAIMKQVRALMGREH